MRRIFVCIALLFGFALCGGAALAQKEALTSQAAFEEMLEKVRVEHNLPALAAAVIEKGKITWQGAVGVRKYGDPTPVTVKDKFHIGSITKSMTATLAMQMAERGELGLDATLGDVFGDLRAAMLPGYASVTMRQLLSHYGGMPSESYPKGVNWWRVPGKIEEQRQKYLEVALKEKPDSEPGTKHLYANRGYIIAGAMIERVMKKSWEAMIQERLFRPIGMTSAGFGPMGTPGKIEQPWQHRPGATPQPVQPVPDSDNAPVLGPAGRVHCSIGDLAKYAAFHLNGERGGSRILSAKGFQTLHTPPGKAEYALGWLVVPRDWAGGPALTHAGSNTMNFAVVWLAPKRHFGVVVATNMGGDQAARACDAVSGIVVTELARRFANR
jgi:CubicO group peptidase (beta-lactamase class C family)